MRGKFFKGIATGAIIGAAAGVLMVPQMDRGTRNRIKKSSRMIRNSAVDMVDGMRHWTK